MPLRPLLNLYKPVCVKSDDIEQIYCNQKWDMHVLAVCLCQEYVGLDKLSIHLFLKYAFKEIMTNMKSL